MNEITREQALELAASEFWKGMTDRQIAEFQLHTKLMCMPFDVFHEAVEKALGRSVWTHEFAYSEQLRAELRGESPAPSFQEIMNMIPEGKRIIVEVSSG